MPISDERWQIDVVSHSGSVVAKANLAKYGSAVDNMYPVS
jgi:hypothetical protein